MIQLRLLSGVGKVLQKIFSMVKPHFFFICWDDNKKAEILSSNLRFNNCIDFSPGEGIGCPSSLCFRMDKTMTHTFGLCESLFLVEISGIEPLTS